MSCVTVQAAQIDEEELIAPVGIYNGVTVPVQLSNNSLLSDFETEGYRVSGYYWIDGTQYPFEGDTYFIYPNSKTVQVDYLIYLPEDISRGESFDVSLRLMHSSATCEYIGVTLYDSNWTADGIWSASSFNQISQTRTDIGLNDLTNNTSATHCFKVMVKFKNVTTNGNFTCYPYEINFTSVSSNGLLNSIISAIGTIISTLLSLPDLIFEAFSNFFDYLINTLLDIYDWISQSLTAIYESMNEWFFDVVTKFNELQSAMQEYLFSVRDSILSGLTQVIGEIKAKLQFVLDGLLDGIYNFFVPSEEQLNVLFDRINEINFGFLSESFLFVYNILGLAFDESVSVNYIDFPLVELQFCGVNWSFGGWRVPLIPAGFEDIFSYVRFVSSAICTICFVNMCRKKLDDIIEG